MAFYRFRKIPRQGDPGQGGAFVDREEQKERDEVNEMKLVD